MDGMCRMMGGMICGWPMLIGLLLTLVLIIVLVVAILAFARRGDRGPGGRA